MKFDYVGVDTETTGVNHQNDEVIEVTATEFNMSGEIGETLSFLCKPMSGFIPKGATDVNGITYEMVKDKPTYLKDGIRDIISKFIGQRTVVGHNLISFDSKFMRIKFFKMEDTLLMARRRFPGKGNKLKTVCARVGIKWDESKAHRADYDAIQCIKLFIKLKDICHQENIRDQELPLFVSPEEILEKINMGVIPTDSEKKMMATQAYSFSRINLFHQCPYKWYMSYIKKVKQPEVDYLVVGKICHKVAEWCGVWVYRELFSNKLAVYAKIKKLDLSKEIILDIAKEFDIKEDEVVYRDFGYYLYKYQAKIKLFFPSVGGLAGLIYEMDANINHESYEKPTMPDGDEFNKIVRNAIISNKCTDTSVIKDVQYIMSKFYGTKDFSLIPGDIMLTEKKLAFDREWKLLSDFFSNKAYMRGIIDVLSYLKDLVIITDYKSSRKMLTIAELKEDPQMKMYVLLVYKLMPRNSYKKIKVRIDYIRFGKSVEYEIEDVDRVANEALEWAETSIKMIEEEMLKTKNAFEPKRNEFCGSCFLASDANCPLFNKQFINNIENPHQFLVKDVEDCQTAWKRIEANKAENTRLTSLCKNFVNGCTSEIPIDTHAILDFYSKESRDFYSVNTMRVLLEKGLKIEQITKAFSITEAKFNALVENNALELTEEELNKISKKKVSSKFEAVTREEAKIKKYINA